MSKAGAQEKAGILQWMLKEAFNKHSQGNSAAMADALQLPQADVKKALKIGHWRSSPEAFDRLFAYCLRNKISLDGLMYRYPK